MAGQREIRWTEAQLARLDRLVNQIQAASRTKAFRAAPDLHIDRSAKVIKGNIYTPADLVDYERMAAALTAKNLKQHKTRQGVEYTQAGVIVANAYVRIVNRKRAREAEKFGIDVAGAIKSGMPLTEQTKMFMPSPKIKPQEYKSARYYGYATESVWKQGRKDYYKGKYDLYKKNMIKALNNKETGFSDYDAAFLIAAIKKLTPFELFMLTNGNPLFSFDFIYSEVDASLKTETILQELNEYLKAHRRKTWEYVPEDY